MTDSTTGSTTVQRRSIQPGYSSGALTSRSSTEFSPMVSPSAERQQQLRNKQKESKRSKPWSMLLLGRTLFVVCIIIVAIVLGVFSYRGVSRSNYELAEAQFESIAVRVLTNIERTVLQQSSGSQTLARTIGQARPDASDYPFVTLDGFDEITESLMKATNARDFAIAPFVEEAQVAEFEAFAQNYYQNQYPEIPDIGVKDFGFGIWNTNTTTEEAYHDIMGEMTEISNDTFLTPILQYSIGGAWMLNVRAEPTRALQMEHALQCVRKNQMANRTHACSSITEMVEIRAQQDYKSPGAVGFAPIRPANNPDQVTGFVAGVLIWEELLGDLFAETVSGICCVLESSYGNRFTYQVTNGKVDPIGYGGELHDFSFSNLNRSTDLNPPAYTALSPQYKLYLVPLEDFFETYDSVDPVLATLGIIGVMILTTVTFVVYDGCVRREFSSNKELLEARRRFVRYISHEVRTPLNSVCMGLTLMQEGKAKTCGFATATEMEKRIALSEADNGKEQQSIPEENDENGGVAAKTPSSAVDPKDQEEFTLLADLLNNAQSSVDVLNDFLNYDKIESGSLSLDLSVINIRQLVESTMQEFQSSAAQKRLSYTLDFDDQSGMSNETAVIGDSVRLRQVLRNLISNAVKFTPKDGSVEITAQMMSPLNTAVPQKSDEFKLKDRDSCRFTPRGQIQVTVKDSGAGLQPSQVDKLFSAGVQFNPNKLQAGQGSGLGLFIAKGIVEQHAGAITARSEGLDKGASFTIRLPLHVVSAEEIETGNAFSTPTTPMIALLNNNLSSATKRSILIVDDAPTNRKLLKRLLEHHGHTCDTAEDGAVAVTMVCKAAEEGRPYDTVLMDYEMPVMNGPDSTAKIRTRGFGDTFVVGVTGSMFPEDTERFISSGANAVLPKPFKMESLNSLWNEYR